MTSAEDSADQRVLSIIEEAEMLNVAGKGTDAYNAYCKVLGLLDQISPCTCICYYESLSRHYGKTRPITSRTLLGKALGVAITHSLHDEADRLKSLMDKK